MKTHRTIRFKLAGKDVSIFYAKVDDQGRRDKMWTMANEIIAYDCKVVGFDIETYKLDKFLYHEKAGLAPYITGIRLIQFYLPNGYCYIFDAYEDEVEVLKILEAVFRKKEVVGHTVQFDVGHVRRYAKYPIKAHCTQIMYELYRHAVFADANEEDKYVNDVDWLTKKDTFSVSLRYITGALLGIEVDKNMQKSNWNELELSKEQLVYAASDVKYTYDCAKILGKKLKHLKLGKIYELNRKCIEPIAIMHNNGITLDNEAHKELIAHWEKEVRKVKREILKTVDVANINSSKQLHKWITDTPTISGSVKRAWPKSPKTGLFSTDAKALKARRSIPFVEAMLIYRKMNKLATTYGKKLAEKVNPVTKRIHCSYTIGHTVTGRLSSRDPNLTNQPRDEKVRAIYVASKEENSLVCADYSQIEMRVAAHLSKDPAMLSVFAEGKDIYSYTASRILHKPLEDIDPKGEERQKAKAVVLGLIFGLGAKGISAYAKNSYGTIISEVESQVFYDGFFRTYTAYAAWQKYQRKFAKQHGYVLTVVGKKRRLEEGNKFTSLHTCAVNTPVQGTAAEIMKQAIVLVQPKIKRAALLLSVHDELLMECKTKNAKSVAKELNAEMVTAAEMILPGIIKRGLVNVGIGNNWGEAK